MTRPDVGMTAANLLPVPVRAFWVVVMVALLVLFVRRVLATSDERRLWYAVYAFAAICLGAMFALNPMTRATPSSIAILVAAALGALGLAGWMVANRDEGGFALPWAFALADLIILAYIQVPSPSRPVIICSAMAAYLAVQVIARGIGAFRTRREPDVAAGRGRGLIGAALGPALEPPEPPRGARRGSPKDGARTRTRTRTATPPRVSALVPVGLSVLTLGMLYMISI